jgi:hypothetical protein
MDQQKQHQNRATGPTKTAPKQAQKGQQKQHQNRTKGSTKTAPNMHKRTNKNSTKTAQKDPQKQHQNSTKTAPKQHHMIAPKNSTKTRKIDQITANIDL